MSGCHAALMIPSMEGADNSFMDAHIYLEITELACATKAGSRVAPVSRSSASYVIGFNVYIIEWD
eukprot:6167391-Pyramimonas_sp.AAC.1